MLRTLRNAMIGAFATVAIVVTAGGDAAAQIGNTQITAPNALYGYNAGGQTIYGPGSPYYGHVVPNIGQPHPGYSGRPMTQPRPHLVQRPMHRPQFVPMMRPVYAGAAYGGGMPMRHPQRPVQRVPSPDQIAAQVPHQVTRERAPCAATYNTNQDGSCSRTRWVPY